ncbi:hypothetical protein ABRY23_09310 [Melioribacteraceae bacterium 4301-Me]|uniref:hypothetical protein n=1 Tax=Pyranulibacter aquaticus TaxID=3163344 RepID=UPI00359629E6
MAALKNYSMLFISLILLSCSSITLKPVRYGWPIEDVQKVDQKGFININRYSTKINVKQIFFLETNDSTNVKDKEIRLIRDDAGFYYFTSPGFKHVYIFKSDEGSMKLENQILINQAGLKSPAMNQRNSYIEIIDGEKTYMLNNKGIVR